MGRSLFEWIADLINGNHSANIDRTSSTTSTMDDNHPVADNAILRRQKLVKSIISSLKASYEGLGMSMDEKKLVLWIKDGLFYQSLTADTFKEDLYTTINNECGLNFAAIVIKSGLIPEDNIVMVMDDCFLQVIQIQDARPVSKAMISAIEGRGSLIDGIVELDSAAISELPNSRYNIGAGKKTQTADNSFRENQIAIEDSKDSLQYDNNKYVSRAHAHISFSDQYGFMLYVEHGGTRLAQKRTHIHRGGEIIEIDNPLAPVQLQDGDIIVLSKHVYLQFNNKM